MNRPQAPHWLSSVASAAGLQLALPATPDLATLRRAWIEVVKACKVPEERFLERVAGHFRTTPTPEGELISIRLIAQDEIPTLDSLNFGGSEGKKIRELLRRRDGLILVTGPARAGTTSFIYACLHAL